MDARAAHAYWHGTEEGFANMGGYDEYDWPYTAEDVQELEDKAERIAALIHDPFSPDKFRRIELPVLENLIYDAMVALHERLIANEGF